MFVDDTDEFADHQLTLAYPPDVIIAAEAACNAVFEAVDTRSEPFGEVGRSWLARLMASDT